jgi:hypothetical protein
MSGIITEDRGSCKHFLSQSPVVSKDTPADLPFSIKQTIKLAMPGQDCNHYFDSGYSLPMNLMMPAYHIKETLLKRNKASMARVFKQIAHMCITSDKNICYKKQATLGEGCGRFEGKKIGRKQVGRHERSLSELGLYVRSRYLSEMSYDRALTPLGTVVYLLLTKAVKFRPSEKMSQPKSKNVPTQFLRQSGNIYLNTTSSESKRELQKPKKENAIAQKVEEKTGMKLVDIFNLSRFDIEFQKERADSVKKADSALSMMRRFLK